MSKKRSGVDNGMVQLTLPLSSLPTANLKAGALRVKDAVREALVAALDRSGLDREYVASELSRLVGEAVSIHALNNYTSESKSERRLPLEYAAALAVILRDKGILDAALGSGGFLVLGKEERAIYEIGRLAVEKKRRARRERELWERLND